MVSIFAWILEIQTQVLTTDPSAQLNIVYF